MILFTEEKLCQLRKVVAENPGLLQGLRKSCETVLRYGARIPETGYMGALFCLPGGFHAADVRLRQGS